jgi:predicted outer membrane protein
VRPGKLLDIEFKEQFAEPKTQTQRKYNRLLGDLFDTYEHLIETKEDLSFSRDELEGAGQDIVACAQGYDADDIRNAVERAEQELSDFESYVADVEDDENYIDRTVKEMMKIEKKMKFKPTLRNEIVRAAESLIED